MKKRKILFIVIITAFLCVAIFIIVVILGKMNNKEQTKNVEDALDSYFSEEAKHETGNEGNLTIEDTQDHLLDSTVSDQSVTSDPDEAEWDLAD